MFRRRRLPVGERHDVSPKVCDICAQTNTRVNDRTHPVTHLHGESSLLLRSEAPLCVNAKESTRRSRRASFATLQTRTDSLLQGLGGRTVPDVGPVANGGSLLHVLLEGRVRRIGERHGEVALDRAEPDDHVRPRL